MGALGTILGFGLVGLLITLVVIGFGIFCFVFWVLMIVDCIQRKFKEDTEKIVWILVLIFAGILGALIYYFIVKKHTKKHKK